MKITKSMLKQLIREELITEGVDPMDMLKMLCASEIIGVKILEEMMEAVLNDPTNLLVVLGPYREKIESVINMKLEDAVNLAMSFSIELPMIGAVSLKQALDMAAKNPMVKSLLKGMIPTVLNAACQGVKQLPESKKITKSKLKQLIKEELESLRETKAKIICPNCGHLNEGDVDACAKCGHPRGKKGPKDGKHPGKPWQKEEE
tara:strand:+ start:296 stop:907 length:612 start_codon:yes stop_codon:yes gene_type:complete